MPLLLLQLADQHLCVTLANLFYQININLQRDVLSYIELNLYKVTTLRVSASGCLMEVGQRVVILAFTIFSRNITLFWNKRPVGKAVLVYNRASPSISDCIFLHHILKLKPNCCVSSTWWPLNRGDNYGEFSLGWPKGGSGQWMVVAT